MPSEKTNDERSREALQALSGSRTEFHSALVATIEEVRALLDAQSATAETREIRTAAELGSFAVGHIDIEKFASLQAAGPKTAPVNDVPRLEAAYRTLQALADSGDDLFIARVESGGDLRATVESALASAGRAFGAARTVDLARMGSYDRELHGSWLESFPPRLWNRREREVAPPLVVEVDGADLRAAGLADFMDGVQRIVLVVSGQAPPAALVRLITPGVLVVQTDAPDGLAPIGQAGGPGIAALVTGDACLFSHVPDSSESPGAITVSRMVDGRPKRALGSISAFQQTEDLRLLAGLATGWGLRVGAANGSVPTGDGSQAPLAGAPADQLAAWILRQANLSGLD